MAALMGLTQAVVRSLSDVTELPMRRAPGAGRLTAGTAGRIAIDLGES